MYQLKARVSWGQEISLYRHSYDQIVRLAGELASPYKIYRDGYLIFELAIIDK